MRLHPVVRKLSSARREAFRGRFGAITVLSAVLMVVLLAMIAFAIDIGYIVNIRTELQRTADAGALAGAGRLVEGQSFATEAVEQYVGLNLVGGRPVATQDLEIETGHWDEVTQTFTSGGELPTAIRVKVARNAERLFFGPVLGRDEFDAEAESIATYRPRDIMLVLDCSASMNDDSELRSIGTIGQGAVEANLLQIYNELGAPVLGNMQWNPVYISSTNSSVIASQLGLTNVPYPYPSGSWSSYFSYVQNNGSLSSAGYRKDYGYLTWINYLLEDRPKHSETPDLWMTSEQPITAVKDAVSVFLSFMQAVDTEDKVGLSIYTSANGNAVLESGLTGNYTTIENISRARQAGHYDVYTNIGAGLKVAREEIEQNARPGALKLIVLMTDGVANRPSNTTTARNYALSEAQLAASAKVPVVTISLGAGADTDLMQQIADITRGIHFNIPGGQSVDEYEEDLKDVFRQIAQDRALRLVQ